MGIELHDAIAFRIIDVVAEDHGAAFEIRESCIKSIRPIKYVISEDQCDGVLANEGFGNQKSLGNSLGPGLLAVFDPQAPRTAIPEQLAEARQIMWRGNEAKLPDTAFDKSRQRVIDHRFIKDRLKLLACDQCEREQAGTSTPGQDDAFHSVGRIDLRDAKRNEQRISAVSGQ